MSDDVKIVLSDNAVIRSEVNKVSKGTLRTEEPQTEFIIRFSPDVDEELLTKATVFIIDSQGNYLSSEIKKVVPKKCFVLKPLDKYEDDKPYYLVIAPRTNINEKHDRSIFVLFVLRSGKLVESRLLKSTDPRITRILQSKDISQYAEKNVRIINEIDLKAIKSGPCNKVVGNNLYGGSLYLLEDRLMFEGLVSKSSEASKREDTYMLSDIKQVVSTVVFNEIMLIMQSGETVLFKVNGRDAWAKEIRQRLKPASQSQK